MPGRTPGGWRVFQRDVLTSVSAADGLPLGAPCAGLVRVTETEPNYWCDPPRLLPVGSAETTRFERNCQCNRFGGDLPAPATS